MGVIDKDYYGNPDNDGHIMFAFYNIKEEDIMIKKGEAIGQAIFQKYLVADDDDAEGERTGGFGSTNKYTCYVDVDQVEKDSPETITATVEDIDKNSHYTVIEIKKLNKKTKRSADHRNRFRKKTQTVDVIEMDELFAYTKEKKQSLRDNLGEEKTATNRRF